MASIRITVNGKNIMVDGEKSYAELREALKVLCTTQNIDASGPQDAVKSLVKTGENFGKKPATDMLEIYETPSTAGATEKKVLDKTSVVKIAQRIADALNAEKRAMNIVKTETTKESKVSGPVATEADY